MRRINSSAIQGTVSIVQYACFASLLSAETPQLRAKHIRFSKALPLPKNAPASTPIGKDQPPPNASLTDLNYRLPHTSLSITWRIHFPCHSHDLPRRTLDRELGRLVAPTAAAGRRVGVRRCSRDCVGEVRTRNADALHAHRAGRADDAGAEHGGRAGDGEAALWYSRCRGERRRVLPDGEDKSVVHGEVTALWLRDIEVVSLSVGRRMPGEERV